MYNRKVFISIRSDVTMKSPDEYITEVSNLTSGKYHVISTNE